MCEDNTINVYDAVTGVLKLSLNPPQQVTKAESSPDGSILFFAHQRAREITVWDTQTGGFVHTFATTSDINDIAVSLKGKYLGSCSSDGTFESWEVESRCRGSCSLSKAVMSVCWLEPEDQVALALEWSIVILEVTTGSMRMLCVYPLEGSLRGVAFSACQHKLAVSLVLEPEGKLHVVDIQTGATQKLRHTPRGVSSLTFSNNGDRVICATNNGDLLSCEYRSSFKWDHHLSHLGTIHSMSPLRGGHLVVGSRESIQLLGSEYTRLFGAGRDPEIAHVCQLDTDRTICGSSKDHKDVSLLDMATMKILANHRTEFDELDDSFTPRFLCTSIDERIAILHLRKPDSFALRRCESGWTDFTWEQIPSRPVLLGALSPNGWYLITVSEGEDPSGGGDWELCVRDAVGSGEVIPDVVPFIQKGRPPSKIAFTSEGQFYIEERRTLSASPDEDHHVQLTSTPPIVSEHLSLTQSIPRTHMSKQPEVCHTRPRVRKSVTRGSDDMTTSTTNSDGQPRTGIRHKEYRVRRTFSLKSIWSNKTSQLRTEIEEVPGEEILSVFQPYSLDENLEWVVDSKSRRVCWLPPGYVTGIEDGHFFVDSSIVTAGKDGVVRKLTFIEPRSDS